MIRPGLQEDFGVGQVVAGDVAGELTGRVDQVPVVPEWQYRFLLSGDFHFTKCHSASKVLLEEGAQTGGVEVLLQDSVLLAEVHGVDFMAVHQINHG